MPDSDAKLVSILEVVMEHRQQVPENVNDSYLVGIKRNESKHWNFADGTPLGYFDKFSTR